jgi:transcriptional regulator with XRE-family HTH domain
MDTFSTVVKKARLEKHLTLEAVATKIGSHKGYVSGFENRKVNPPSSRIVRKLAKLYGLDQKRLLILAEIEKIDPEVREVFREGAFQVYGGGESAPPAAAATNVA